MDVRNPTEVELNEILFQFDEKPTHSPYSPTPKFESLRLTDLQLEALLEFLAPLKNPSNAKWVRQQLSEAAEYFSQSLWHQETIAPSEAKKRLTRIRIAARNLIDAFQPDGVDELHARHYVQSFMRMAAERYGNEILQAKGKRSSNLPWNFWTAYRLPSAIQSVELLEHWAEMAIAMQDAIGKGKAHKGRIAIRVLIHRLALAWNGAKGEFPGAGFNAFKSKAEGPFFRFAIHFVGQLKGNVTELHRAHLPDLDAELGGVNANVVRGHLKPFLRRAKRPSKQTGDMAKSRKK